ncbi:uncharacterized protein [Typha angustifolia]|uniref:uncharacterized protein n=1 Tax=Typha angustifolia TaxID=59011 RepID=UPI003C30D2B2
MAVTSSSAFPMILAKGHHRRGDGARRRFLVSVTVLGSTGPLRFLVNEGELVAAVIRTALRSYAQEGRFPVLSSNLDDFLLYSANGGSNALSPVESVSFHGSRNFVLCKKLREIAMEKPQQSPSEMIGRKVNGSWKGGFNRLLSFRISSQ